MLREDPYGRVACETLVNTGLVVVSGATSSQLNVFEHFRPKLSPAARESEVLFLANIQPRLHCSSTRSSRLSAAREVLGWGPSVVLAKQGEYGAALVTPDSFFSLPAYPLETVVDPTGAGDTFAGGFVGYLARHLDEAYSDERLHQAMAYGTALASFNVEEFGTERVARLTSNEISARVDDLRQITHFEHEPLVV